MTNAKSKFAEFMVKDTTEVVKRVISERFTDNNDNPLEWELQPVTADKDDLLRKESTKKIPLRNGQHKPELDMNLYLTKLCVNTIIYPNLNDVELQNFYGVKNAEALLGKMLKPGEYQKCQADVMEVNGFDLSMNELVDEAKN